MKKSSKKKVLKQEEFLWEQMTVLNGVLENWRFRGKIILKTLNIDSNLKRHPFKPMSKTLSKTLVNFSWSTACHSEQFCGSDIHLNSSAKIDYLKTIHCILYTKCFNLL